MKSSVNSRGIRKSLALVIALGQVSICAMLPASAADNKVRVAGSPVFSISGPIASSSDRADKIQHNIDNSLVASASHGPSAVKITYVKGLPVITLGGYYLTTVDNATAKAAGSTPSILAQKWATALKSALANQSSVDAYIAQLTGKSDTSDYVSDSSSPDNAPAYQPSTVASAAPSYQPNLASDTVPALQSANSQSYGWQPVSTGSSYSSNTPAAYAYNSPAYGQVSQNAYPANPSVYQGRVSYVPAGMMIPVKLATSLSSQVAKAGDIVIAKTSQDIVLANGVIPAGSTITGTVSDAANGAFFGRSGKLGIKFTSLRTPNGVETPLTAHISGSVGKYNDKDNDTFRGETAMSKVKKSLVATAVGAGAGSAMGVAVGAIAAGGHGVGRGAWSGAAIGSGVGLAESLLVRRGSEVTMVQGQEFNLQLDAPVTVAMN
ncbi:MAG: hypothetical protein K2X27_26960 [Candidatus Obscuribacterales bacterium]|nr:hypothetical protein [Candidatus Obscuribacterales bacterium]